MFKLNPLLDQDCLFITDLALSRILLKNDVRFLWLILVPRRPNITEIFELNLEDRHLLFEEIIMLSPILKNFNHADKLNISAIGNIVPDLHIHMIARHKTDVLWPKPVWGLGDSPPYSEEISQDIIERLRTCLS